MDIYPILPVVSANSELDSDVHPDREMIIRQFRWRGNLDRIGNALYHNYIQDIGSRVLRRDGARRASTSLRKSFSFG